MRLSNAIRTGVAHGYGVDDLRSELAEASGRYQQSLRVFRHTGVKAKALVEQVEKAAAAGSTADTRAQLLAREAYYATVASEAMKFKVGYQLLALRAKTETLEHVKAAQVAVNAKAREARIVEAERAADRADVLTQAAEATEKVTSSIPVPDVFALREAEPAPNEIGTNGAGWKPSYHTPLMHHFFTEDSVGALSGLADLGDPSSFWGRVKEGLGFGASTAGQAAIESGVEVAGVDPSRRASVGLVMGVAASLSRMFGLQYEAPGRVLDTPREQSIPWGKLALGVGAVGLAGFLIWKVTR